MQLNYEDLLRLNYMEIKNVLQDIKRKYIDNEPIEKIVESICEKWNIDNTDSLEELVRLLYVFYVLDDLESVKLVCKELSNVSFSGNYGQWTWIEMAIVLYIRLQNIPSIAENLKENLLNVLEIGNDLQKKVNKKNFARMLNGETLDFSDIQTAVEESDKPSEINYRMTFLMQLIKIKEMGASEKFTLEMAEQRIQENISSIKKLFKVVPLNKILPFSVT
jgi:hypothetical protein